MDHNQQLQLIQLSVDNSRENKRLLFCVPESAGDIFLSTSLLPSLKSTYAEFDIYFACKPQYAEILTDNPNIYKVLDYYPVMDMPHLMEGFSDWEGIFDISILATALTQRYINYHHNGIDVVGLDIHARD